jgi:hypothetical protein
MRLDLVVALVVDFVVVFEAGLGRDLAAALREVSSPGAAIASGESCAARWGLTLG